MSIIVADASGAFCHLDHRGTNKRTRWNLHFTSSLLAAYFQVPSLVWVQVSFPLPSQEHPDRGGLETEERQLPVWFSYAALYVGQSSPFSDVPRCGGLAGRVHHNARSQRGLFCRCCEAPEIHVRCRGKIGEGRPHCDRLVELLWIDLVERVVCGVMGVEIIESVLAQ